MKKLFFTFLVLFLGVNVVMSQENKTFTVGDVTFEMVYVQGGTFTMGCTDESSGECRPNEMPAHEVTVSDFYIGKYEVTQKLWVALMGDNPCYDQGDNRCVARISWAKCQEFITKLNNLTGETFRLPTEAEWEYAAKGGNKSQGYKYSGSNNINEVGWIVNTGPIHNVGLKAPNELGIYDMSGNVWEWCQDWYDNYGVVSETDPVGPENGTYRIMRGGSWESKATQCRVTSRGGNYPVGNENMNTGFRLALVPKTTSNVEESSLEVPEGAVKGIFSISADKKVFLSKGNLQYQPSTETWRFSENPWDMIGNPNMNVSNDYEGWIDMMAWGTGRYPAVKPSGYCKDIKVIDWGKNDISNSDVTSWRTLLKDEWEYLFNARNTTSGIRYARASVHNVNGVILLPDDWDTNLYELKDKNIISDTDWTDIFEANGVAFLPAAGFRDVNNFNSLNREGYYWSMSNDDMGYAYCLLFSDYNFSSNYMTTAATGCAVRLVCPTDAIKYKNQEQDKPVQSKSNGKFSVSDEKQVCFSKGNLQYNPSKGIWRFARRPWYVLSREYGNQYSYGGSWIDLFGWGTGDNPSVQSANNGDYVTFHEWGENKIANGEGKEWFTLSNEEWNYLFNTRTTTSGMRYVRASIDCVPGVILFPDDWNANVYKFKNVNYPTGYNVVSDYDWDMVLEPNGAIFLPCSGQRVGGSVRYDSEGFYWSATSPDDANAVLIYITKGGIDFSRVMGRSLGAGVRLVCLPEE